MCASRQTPAALRSHARSGPWSLRPGKVFTYCFFGVRLRPGELSTVQPAHAQPVAIAIPARKLQTGAALVAEHVGGAVARHVPERLLHMQGQAVRACATSPTAICAFLPYAKTT
jgi:hypothetical protein